jgi:hypothetical protein
VEEPPAQQEEQQQQEVPASFPKNEKKTVSQTRRPSVSKKRPVNGNDEPEDDGSAFYLRHQNRALATELKSLQFAVSSLQEERDSRRRQCLKAVQALHSLHATWAALETALQAPAAAAAAAPSAGASSSQPDERIPSSTTSASLRRSVNGPEENADTEVEWTAALHDALVALGRQQGGRQQSASLEDVEEVAANIAARAKVLQECLWNVIRDGGAANGMSTTTVESAELARQLAAATAELQLAESRAKELTQSRQDMAARERKVRRNVYRLGAGMLTAEQVVSAVDGEIDDEEGRTIKEEVEREKAELQAIKQEQQPVPTSATEGVSSSSDDRPASAAVVDKFKSEIVDLQQAVANAERSIQEVRFECDETELFGTYRSM